MQYIKRFYILVSAQVKNESPPLTTERPEKASINSGTPEVPNISTVVPKIDIPTVIGESQDATLVIPVERTRSEPKRFVKLTEVVKNLQINHFHVDFALFLHRAFGRSIFSLACFN